MKIILRRILAILALSTATICLIAPLDLSTDKWEIYIKVGGGLILVAGLVLLNGLYPQKRGIMVTPPAVSKLWDFLSFCFVALSAYAAIDYILSHFLGTVAKIEEEFHFMGIFFIFLGLPILSLFTSLTSAQSIVVERTGVTSYGLGGEKFMSWGELKEINIQNQYVLVTRVGLPMPKKLRKVLELKGTTKSIRINEPPLNATKERIVSSLLKNVPEEWKDEVTRIGQEW